MLRHSFSLRKTIGDPGGVCWTWYVRAPSTTTSIYYLYIETTFLFTKCVNYVSVCVRVRVRVHGCVYVPIGSGSKSSLHFKFNVKSAKRLQINIWPTFKCSNNYFNQFCEYSFSQEKSLNTFDNVVASMYMYARRSKYI